MPATSDLLPYENSRIIFSEDGAVVLDAATGRYETSTTVRYLCKCYLKRSQPVIGPETGSRKSPTKGRQDNLMPGASGDSFPYRGYLLQYSLVDGTFELGDDESAITWQNISQPLSWLVSNKNVDFRFGNQRLMKGVAEIVSGRFGGKGIDELIYRELRGIPLTIVGGEVQN